MALLEGDDVIVRVLGPQMNCSGTLVEDDLVLTRTQPRITRSARIDRMRGCSQIASTSHANDDPLIRASVNGEPGAHRKALARFGERRTTCALEFLHYNPAMRALARPALFLASFAVGCAASGGPSGSGYDTPDAAVTAPVDAAVPALTIRNLSYVPAKATGYEMAGIFSEISFYVDNTLTQDVREITALVLKTSTFQGEAPYYENANCRFHYPMLPGKGTGALLTLKASGEALTSSDPCANKDPIGYPSTFPDAYGFKFDFSRPSTRQTVPATGPVTITLKVLLGDGSRAEVTATSK